jgi:hypothetical protein
MMLRGGTSRRADVLREEAAEQTGPTIHSGVAKNHSEASARAVFRPAGTSISRSLTVSYAARKMGNGRSLHCRRRFSFYPSGYKCGAPSAVSYSGCGSRSQGMIVKATCLTWASANSDRLLGGARQIMNSFQILCFGWLALRADRFSTLDSVASCARTWCPTRG